MKNKKEFIINLVDLLIWITLLTVFLYNLLFELTSKIIWLTMLVLISVSLVIKLRRMIKWGIK